MIASCTLGAAPRVLNINCKVELWNTKTKVGMVGMPDYLKIRKKNMGRRSIFSYTVSISLLFI
jgi:hypothetical protein